MAQFQHLTQRAYLDRWKLGKTLYIIEKKTGAATPYQSAKSLLGMEDMQTPEMESAFNDAESSVGLLHSTNEITDDNQKRLFARWIALHAVRCKRHADVIKKVDYRKDVENMTNYSLQLHGCFVDNLHRETKKPLAAFITCDNPCLYLTHSGINFWLIPVSPFRYLCFTPMQAWGESPPWDVNKNIVHAATDHCVSFDSDLHVTRESFDQV